MVAAVTGCSSLDDDVVPEVMHAQIAVNPAAPTQLAMIGVTLKMTAGPRADRSVALSEVTLRPATGALPDVPLKLTFPGRNTLAFKPDDRIVVDLVNIGTTNAHLTPLRRGLPRVPRHRGRRRSVAAQRQHDDHSRDHRLLGSIPWRIVVDVVVYDAYLPER
jgi:hypothetical protein